jgi:tetratricopeptide (TPR) repeat protein
MDFVAGTSLAAMVRDHPLPGPQAARYIQAVAAAMQYAHDRGTLHRDLKPSNVLLDEHGQPRVTDFGLAKRLDADSALTASGTVLGTPSYMPPEQAAGRWSEVGPAADVYSLGATLYELVTGRAPFRAETPFETVRQVIESDPPSPRLLNPRIARDIETICLKCLEKDPRRRYGSARALADDLGRFLEGKPIRARRISLPEQLVRWCRRNPGIAALALVVAALLTAVAAVSAWDAARIRHEQVATQRAAEEAHRAQVAAEQQRQEARENFKLAREAVDKMLTEVGLDQLADVRGMDPVRQALLEKARQFYEQLLSKQSDDPDVRAEVGRAYRRVGQIGLVLGQASDAEANLRRSQEMLDLLVREHASSGQYRSDLADTQLALGWLVYSASRPDEAETAFRQSIELYEAVAGERPDDNDVLKQLGLAYSNLGLLYRDTRRADEAEQATLKAIELRQRLADIQPDSLPSRSALSASLNNLANLYGLTRRPHEAMEQQRKALEIREQLAQAQPNSVQYQTDLAMSYSNMALLHEQLSQLDEADDLNRRSAAVFQRLIQDYPTRVDLILHLARTRMNHGHLLKKLARLDEAVALYELAAEPLEQVLRQDPTNGRARVYLGNTHHGWAEGLEQLKRSHEALAHWERALELIGDRIGDVLRLQRSVSLARTGDHHKASADVTQLATLEILEPTDLYDLACALSLCCQAARNDMALSASEREPLAGQYAAAAIELLRRAATGMPANQLIDKMTNDPDLSAVRSQPAFQAMLRELQGDGTATPP